MSDNIPDHLIANVLLRLPFDSLIRFRCVSKSWCALIDSPDFIKMHSKRSHLIKPYSHSESKIIAFKRKCYAFDSVKAVSGRAIAKELNNPLEFLERKLQMVGSSNGLVCLWYFDKDKTILWNPWIQKYSELPSRPYKYNKKSCTFLLGTAFGYNHVHDDYNVVKWNTFVDFSALYNLPKGPRIYRFKLFVYSLKLNSWSRIEKVIPFELPESHRLFSDNHAVANGALHWYVSDGDKPRYGERFIVSFDLGSKEFRKISCAPCPKNSRYVCTQLCTLNGCLASFCFYHSRERHGGGVIADLWVMEDYGVKKSWTKLTSIDIPRLCAVDRILARGMEIGNFYPVIFSSKRRQLLLQIAWEKLVLYDLEQKSMRDVTIRGEASCYWSCVCAGSLVRPCSYA